MHRLWTGQHSCPVEFMVALISMIDDCLKEGKASISSLVYDDWDGGSDQPFENYFE